MSSVQGRINRKLKNQRLVPHVCKKCGKGYNITYGALRKLKGNYEPICKACKIGLSYINNPIMAAEHRKNISVSWANKTEEEKQMISQKHKNAWNALSDAAKVAHGEQSRRTMRNYWDNITPEEYERRRLFSAEVLKEYRKTMTPEAQKKLRNAASAAAKKRWAEMSPEEYARVQQRTSMNTTCWWESLTEEAFELFRSKISKTVKNWWATLSDESKADWDERRVNGVTRSILNKHMTKSEQEFATILAGFNLQYEYQSRTRKAHPDFHKLFKPDPNKSRYVISPYKCWDFRVIAIAGDVLVDIDGSIHFTPMTPKNGALNIVAAHVAGHDLTRPYRTDGLPAFVVRCPDDVINENTDVLDLQTNETMNIDEFIRYLRFRK